MPSGNPGELATTLQQVDQAVKILQDALQKLPIGSAPHKAVLESVTKLSKVVPAGDQQPGIQKTALQALQGSMDQNGPMSAMIGAMGAQQPAMGAQA